MKSVKKGDKKMKELNKEKGENIEGYVIKQNKRSLKETIHKFLYLNFR